MDTLVALLLWLSGQDVPPTDEAPKDPIINLQGGGIPVGPSPK